MDSEYARKRNREIDEIVAIIVGDRQLDALDEAVIRIAAAKQWDKEHAQEV